MNIKGIIKAQRKFSNDRQWNQFHTPKNLSMALSVEASELVEIFQWLTPKEAKEIMHFKKGKKAVRDELADILYYLIRISDKLGVDLEEAFWEKMKDNAKKYPIKKSKGLAKKYTAL